MTEKIKENTSGKDRNNKLFWEEMQEIFQQTSKMLNEIAEEIEEDKMPLKIYTVVHRDAILTEEEIHTLSTWTELQSDKLLGGN